MFAMRLRDQLPLRSKMTRWAKKVAGAHQQIANRLNRACPGGFSIFEASQLFIWRQKKR
jgi:hypothetical protein